MLHSNLSGEARRIHSCCMRKNEGKILPCKSLSCAAGLSRNRRRQTTPEFHSRTLFFPNQSSILFPDKQSTDHSRRHEELENITFRSCKQGKR
jgi:hypothetical protein